MVFLGLRYDISPWVVETIKSKLRSGHFDQAMKVIWESTGKSARWNDNWGYGGNGYMSKALPVDSGCGLENEFKCYLRISGHKENNNLSQWP